MNGKKELQHIFRSYDVRGVVGKDLDEKVMERIGLAFGNFVKKDIVVANDTRAHSNALKSAFISGFLKTENNVEDAGVLPLGAGVFHSWQSSKNYAYNYAYITGSHLPKEWNGVKFFHANGTGFIEEENYKVRDLFFSDLDNLGSAEKGRTSMQNSNVIIEKYVNFLNSKIKINKKLSVVLDCGNGCAGLVAPQLFEKAGCDIKAIFAEIDSSFPNRLPDPVETELTTLKKEVIGNDLGVAFDGDADRTALVDDKGQFMKPEETSFIILSELLKKEKGPVIANVECTRIIDMAASKFNRPVIRVPVGHTVLMDAVHRHKASFGVEVSGHYALPSIIPFDDSLVVGFYVASILSETKEKLSELRKAIPKTYSERLSYHCSDTVKFEIVKKLSEKLSKDFKNVNKMDGARVDLENGWALIRASNTSPFIRLTVEGATEKDMKEIQKAFLDYLKEEMEKHNLELVPEHK